MSQFEQFELSDGSRALGVGLPIPPYGEALIVAEDTSSDSEAVLRELATSWPQLWPEMLSLLEDGMQNLDIEVKLADQEIVGSVSRTRAGEFMSDKSDVYLSINCGDAPDWDYFIRGAKIVHFQPVF